MEAMEMPLEVSSRVEGFLEAAEELLTWSKETTRAGTLLELLLSSLSESTPPNAGLRIYWLLLKCFPSKKEYRAEFFERFEAMYPMVSKRSKNSARYSFLRSEE